MKKVSDILEYVLHIVDWILFALFAINILYLLVYSLGSRRRPLPEPSPASAYKRIAVLIPAYREDAVILESVRSCLDQDYPTDRYTVVVVSDRMKDCTNAALGTLPVHLVKVHFAQSTKVKSLNAAIESVGNDFDIALVLDADNIIPYNYLTEINDCFANPKVEVVQTHRMAKNLNTDMALLDAISEEINNSIFRMGHAKLGMSAALIGSGMAFRYQLFRDTMADMESVGGFDRELELRLLYQGKRFYYMPETYVFDEKIQNTDDFSNQRRRWISAQFYYAAKFVKYLPSAIWGGKWDFCDKFYQQIALPRLLLLGFTGIITLAVTVFRFWWSLKWWLILLLLVAALVLAVPRRYYTSRVAYAFGKLPKTFWLMASNIFRLRGANKSFIHTKHGLEEGKTS